MNITRNICCDLSIPDATFPGEEIEAEFTKIGFLVLSVPDAGSPEEFRKLQILIS